MPAGALLFVAMVIGRRTGGRLGLRIGGALGLLATLAPLGWCIVGIALTALRGGRALPIGEGWAILLPALAMAAGAVGALFLTWSTQSIKAELAAATADRTG